MPSNTKINGKIEKGKENEWRSWIDDALKESGRQDDPHIDNPNDI